MYEGKRLIVNYGLLRGVVITTILIQFFLPAYSQNIFKGLVIDSVGSKPIPYVNLGIINKNVGTVSDINGHFRLELPEQYDHDEMKISIIGYESKIFKVSEFKNIVSHNQIIKLKESVYELSKIEIISDRLDTHILGNTTTSKVIEAGFKNNALGNEVGIKVKIKKSPTYVERFNFYVTDCRYDSLFFRINIYSIKNGMPAENLLDENIFFSTSTKKGKVTVDLSQYNIVVMEDIIVTIEWIQNLGKGGLNFSAGLFKLPMYHRQTSFGEWKKTSMISLGFNIQVKY
jgi:hypothetical protein